MAQPWIKESLSKAGVPYQIKHHAETFTAQELAHREHISGHQVAKVVVVMVDNRSIILVLPASRKVRLPEVREILGAKDIRLASEKEIQSQFGDCEVGAIPPLRHWQNVDVWVDSTLETKGDILFTAGSHRDAVQIEYHEWFNLVKPRVESFTAPADSPEEFDYDDEGGHWPQS